MDSLDLISFIRKHQIVDHATRLTRLADHINALAPQLPSGFGNDSHKMRYLRRAVMRKDWAKQLISLVTTARYTYTQFINALQESVQLSEELSLAQAPEISYGQYVHNPRDVRYHRTHLFRNQNRYTPMRSRTPYHSRNRSRSPYNRTNGYRAQNT